MNTIAHTTQKVGLASAMAVVLLVIIMVCTAFQKIIMNQLFPNDELILKRAKRRAELEHGHGLASKIYLRMNKR